MALLKRKEHEPIRNFPDLLEDFFGGGMLDSSLSRGASVPSVNIKEQKDNYIIELAAPGLKKDDFNVEVEDGRLIISSEKQDEKEDKDENYTRREFSYQSFQRAFDLPDSVKAEEISAEYNDGVLAIQVPKKEEAKDQGRKKIEIS
ncbi:MAG: Hsp20/alpha crystallin family protein [Flavobacteriales bacterium]